jgi:hypothetical protein
MSTGLTVLERAARNVVNSRSSLSVFTSSGAEDFEG